MLGSRLAARAVRPSRLPARARAARRRRAGVQAPAARGARRSASSPSLRGAPLRAAALPVVACLMLGIAVAQPVVTTTTERSARTSSEVVFVTDVSRSMTAASGPGAPTRLDRARSIVARAPGVRARRPGRHQRSHRPRPALRLPDARRRRRSPRRSRGACRSSRRRRRRSRTSPRASSRSRRSRATASSSRAPSIAPASSSRTARPGATISWDGGCKLVVVRVGAATDRIYAKNGKVDAAYRPESTAGERSRPAGPRGGPVRVLRG